MRDRMPLPQHPDNGRTVLDQHVVLGIGPFSASEHHALGTAQRQSLLRPHRDQIALDLGHQSEGKTQHLAVDRIVEGVSLLGREEVDPFLEALAHDRHHIGQRPA